MLYFPADDASTDSSRRFLPTVSRALFSMRYSMVTRSTLVGVTVISFTLVTSRAAGS